MGLISLPSLVQKIKVDSSELSQAEAKAESFGASVRDQNEDTEDSYTSLQKTQQQFVDSIKQLGDAIQQSTKEFQENTRKQDENEESKKKNRKETEKGSSAFDDFIKKVKGAGTSFGVMNSVMSLAKFSAVGAGAGIAGAGVLTLTASVSALVSQLAPMIGVVGAAGPLMLALKTSTGLVSGAFEELSKSKTSNVVKDLGDIKKAGIEAFSPGFIQSIKTMGPAVDIVERGYAKLGKTLGTAFKDAAKDLMQQPTFLKNLSVVMDNNAKIAGTFAQALSPIAQIVVNIVKAAGPMAQHFAEDFVAGAQAVAGMTSNTKDLEAYFAKAEVTTRRFFGILFDTGVAIKNVLGIAASTNKTDFLTSMENGARSMKEFTQSAEGVGKIKTYFTSAKVVISEVNALIKDTSKYMLEVGSSEGFTTFARNMRTETLPAVVAISSKFANEMLPALKELGKAWYDLAQTLSVVSFIELLTVLTQLTTAVTKVVATVPGLAEFIATVFLIKKAILGLSVVSNVVGLTGLVTTLRAVGPAGAAGATGLGGFIQGLRGAAGESTSLANKLGVGLKAGFVAAGTAIKDTAVSLGTTLKAAAVSAGTAMTTAATNAKAMAVAMLSNVKAAVVSAATSIKAMAVAAYEAAAALAATAAASIRAAFASMVAAIGPIIIGLQGAAAAAKAFTLSLLTNPVFLIVAALVALGVALYELYQHNETFRNAVNAAWAGIKTAIGAVADWFMNTAVPAIKGAFQSVMDAASAVKTWVTTAWNTMTAGIGVAIAAATAAINKVKEWIQIFKDALTPITNGVKTFLTSIKDYFVAAFQNLKTLISTSWNVIATVFKTAMAVVKATLTGDFGAIPGIIKNGMTQAWNMIVDAWNKIKSTTVTGVTNVVNEARQLGSKIAGAVGDLGNLLYKKGQQIVQGLIDGVRSMFGRLGDAAREMAGKFAGVIPGSPVKEGPLRVLNHGYAGKQIVKMLNDGIRQSGGIKFDGLSDFATNIQPASFSASNFPRPPQMMTGQTTGAVDNSRTYNVNVYETTGPTTESSITSRLRLVDVMI